MPTTFTTALRFSKPATGELSGTWGDVVNNGITSLVETAVAGYTSIAMTDANYTLSQANGAADESRSMVLNMTGTLTANRNVVCPNVNKVYVFRNSTTGGFSLILKTSSGTGVTVPSGKIVTVFCDGADNITDITNYLTGTLTVTGALSTSSTLTVTGAATFSSTLATTGGITSGGVVSAPLGAVGAPSYTFTGDTNTGVWSPTADTIALSTAGSERERIDPAGKHLIGATTAAVTRTTTTSVTPPLQTIGTTASTTATLAFRGGADTNGPTHYLAKTRAASVPGYDVVVNGDFLGSISFAGGDGTQMTEGARISAVVDGTPGTDDMPTKLVFYTTPDGSNAPTERMSITSAGVVQDSGGLEFGYRDIPRVTGGIERGKMFATAAGFTLNTGTAAGGAYSVYNNSASAITVTQGAGLTLRLAGTTTTGSRTIAARGIATIWFNSTTEAIMSGPGVS